MSAMLQTTREAEPERIIRWRTEELERANYSSEDATRLADAKHVDLRVAINLVQRGCSPELAVQILL